MDQYEYIRTAQRAYGKNVSEIPRETGHSRNTVNKALRGEFTGYSPWTEVFGNANMTAALLDRLTHKAYIIECSWESYKL